MKLVKQSEGNTYTGKGYSGIDYPVMDSDIDFAVIKINGRSPEIGYQVNTECKEILYIIKGSGILFLRENSSTYPFNEGDVLLLQKGEYYAFDGNFVAGVSCNPAWRSEQHQYVEE